MEVITCDEEDREEFMACLKKRLDSDSTEASSSSSASATWGAQAPSGNQESGEGSDDGFSLSDDDMSSIRPQTDVPPPGSSEAGEEWRLPPEEDLDEGNEYAAISTCPLCNDQMRLTGGAITRDKWLTQVMSMGEVVFSAIEQLRRQYNDAHAFRLGLVLRRNLVERRMRCVRVNFEPWTIEHIEAHYRDCVEIDPAVILRESIRMARKIKMTMATDLTMFDPETQTNITNHKSGKLALDAIAAESRCIKEYTDYMARAQEIARADALNNRIDQLIERASVGSNREISVLEDVYAVPESYK
jgi:hypothetical protein